MKCITTLFLVLTSLLIKAQTVTTVTEGLFHDGLALDASGNLYGSDFPGTEVYKYDTNGNVTVFKDGFTSPNGIGISPEGDIYVCDHFGQTIYKYDDEGTLLSTYSGLTTPAGIKNIPGTSNMIFVEYNTSTIKIIDASDDSISTLFSGSPLNGPAGITFINDIAYFGNFLDRKIFRLSKNNTLEEVAQLPNEAAEANFLGFLTNFNGNILATQIGEGRIYRINPTTGDVSVFAGSVTGNTDGPISDARFNNPNGIIADPVNDRIYVSDAATKNLRIIEGASLGLDISNIDNLQLKVYPNPSNDLIILKGQLKNASAYILSIYNISGKKIETAKREDVSSIFEEVDVSNWPQGTYIFKIESGDRKQITRFLKD